MGGNPAWIEGDEAINTEAKIEALATTVGAGVGTLGAIQAEIQTLSASVAALQYALVEADSSSVDSGGGSDLFFWWLLTASVEKVLVFD